MKKITESELYNRVTSLREKLVLEARDNDNAIQHKEPPLKIGDIDPRNGQKIVGAATSSDGTVVRNRFGDIWNVKYEPVAPTRTAQPSIAPQVQPAPVVATPVPAPAPVVATPVPAPAPVVATPVPAPAPAVVTQLAPSPIAAADSAAKVSSSANQITNKEIAKATRALATANGITISPHGMAIIKPGDVIKLPNGTSAPVDKGDTLWGIAKRYLQGGYNDGTPEAPTTQITPKTQSVSPFRKELSQVDKDAISGKTPTKESVSYADDHTLSRIVSLGRR
jgi:LysM repeat protein